MAARVPVCDTSGMMWSRDCGWARMAATISLCVAVLAGCEGRGWCTQDEAPVPTLHAYTNLVQVPTLVLSMGRRQMPPVPESRFFVSIDGGPKFHVTHVRREGDEPIMLAILLDLRQSETRVMESMEDAIAGLAPESLHPTDRVSVYAMGCTLVRTSNAVPASAASLRHAVHVVLADWKGPGSLHRNKECPMQWNLWDSMLLASHQLSKEPGWRVLLAVTNGQDEGSKTRWNELRLFAQNNAVAMYGMAQADDLDISLSRAARSKPEVALDGMCQLTGGIVTAVSRKNAGRQLKQFVETLRARYIVEFPRPYDITGGYRDMEITIAKSDAFVRPAGVTVRLADPKVLADPTTVPSDPTNAPQLGKRKVLTPN